jgi:hypothetical protein
MVFKAESASAARARLYRRRQRIGTRVYRVAVDEWQLLSAMLDRKIVTSE